MPDDSRDRRRNDSAGAPVRPPSVPASWDDDITGQYAGEELARRRAERDDSERLAILETKADEIRELRTDLRTVNKLVDAHNTTIELALKPLAERLPDQLSGVAVALAKLSKDVDNVANQMRAHVASISKELRDHHGRIAAVEDRSARHEVRLQQLEELPPRVVAVEAHVAGDARELSLTRKQQRRLDARAGVISTAIGAIAALLSHLLGG